MLPPRHRHGWEEHHHYSVNVDVGRSVRVLPTSTLSSLQTFPWYLQPRSPNIYILISGTIHVCTTRTVIHLYSTVHHPLFDWFWVVARSTFPTSLTQEAMRGGRRQVLPYEHHSGAEGWKAKGAFQKGTLLYLGSIYVLTSSVPTGNCLSGFLTDENSLPSQLASDGRRCTLFMLRGAPFHSPHV